VHTVTGVAARDNSGDPLMKCVMGLANRELLFSTTHLDALRGVSSLSHGAKWNALISRYIETIPVSGDAAFPAEHSMSGMLPLWILVSIAIMAKVGAAARDSQ
jgi:hypothetical protein